MGPTTLKETIKNNDKLIDFLLITVYQGKLDE